MLNLPGISRENVLPALSAHGSRSRECVALSRAFPTRKSSAPSTYHRDFIDRRRRALEGINGDISRWEIHAQWVNDANRVHRKKQLGRCNRMLRRLWRTVKTRQKIRSWPQKDSRGSCPLDCLDREFLRSRIATQLNSFIQTDIFGRCARRPYLSPPNFRPVLVLLRRRNIPSHQRNCFSRVHEGNTVVKITTKEFAMLGHTGTIGPKLLCVL